MPKKYEVTVVTPKKSNTLNKVYSKALVATGAVMPVFAFALEGDGALDMSSATTQLGYGLAAIGALGAAKLAPAALMWVWRKVNNAATS